MSNREGSKQLFLAQFLGGELKKLGDVFINKNLDAKTTIQSTSEDGRIKYTSINDKDANSCHNFAIVVKNGETMSIFPAVGVKMMAQAVTMERQDQIQINQTTSLVIEDDANKKFISKRAAAFNDLNSTFGTQKRQREMARFESNKQNLASMFSASNENISDNEDYTRSMESPDVVHSLKRILAENVVGEAQKNNKKQEQFNIIPLVNFEAKMPIDVYEIPDNVIPNSSLEVAKKVVKRLLLSDTPFAFPQLPSENSTYLKSRYKSLSSIKKPSKTKLRLLYIYYTMQCLYHNNRIVGNKEKLIEKMGLDCPPIIIEDLIKEFTVHKFALNSQNRFLSSAMTSQMIDKLLCFMFVLCLHIDEFSTDPMMLSADLGLRPTRTFKLFKSLGCTISSCTESQRISLGLSKTEASHYKRADLNIPLVFPKQSRGMTR